jgi:hypothetical protein
LGPKEWENEPMNLSLGNAQIRCEFTELIGLKKNMGQKGNRGFLGKIGKIFSKIPKFTSSI